MATFQKIYNITQFCYPNLVTQKHNTLSEILYLISKVLESVENCIKV